MTMKILLLFTPLLVIRYLLFVFFVGVNAQLVVLSQSKETKPVFELTLSRSPPNRICTLISSKTVQRHRLLSNYNEVVVQKRHVLDQRVPSNPEETLEWLRVFGHTLETAWSKVRELCTTYTTDTFQVLSAQQQQPLSQSTTILPTIKLFSLVNSGLPGNRIDITFFADGYLANEKEKFLSDARRLAHDISYNHTFASVKPLLNFWAAFSPSNESGIGVAGVPKNTVYGLYRDGTELRGVYCSKPDVARLACQSLGTKCDYPLLLSNDPYYGGLGGEFTISTASEINGALVLRHELGHSIIEIGEEYDGGFAYYGVNAAHNLTGIKDVPWGHWLSDPSDSDEIKIERSIMPFQSYAWTMLNTTTPWSATFTSSGNYTWHRVRFSLSGLPNASDLKVYLDGNDLHWKPRLDIGLDRWHYDILHDTGLKNTIHELRFELLGRDLEGVAQLCSAEIIEYGDEEEFNTTIGNYGIYPTFSIDNMTSYRPTNEQCLMRLVTSPDFCNVCLEGLWLSLLSRITLIDDVIVNLHESSPVLVIEIIPIPLGQFRSEIPPNGEVYSIDWTKDDILLVQYSNMTRAVIQQNIYGTWRINLNLHTPDVRRDTNRLLQSDVEIKVLPGLPPLVTIPS